MAAEKEATDMILADKIISLRKQKGWSQEELAHQMDVSRQAVSKWESASSIPDLDRILKLGQLFQVSTDYLLKEEIESVEEPVIREREEEEERGASVSLEEATTFLSLKQKLAMPTALAVMSFILCPIPLILLAGLSEEHVLGISEDLAGGMGILVILAVVSAAVAVLLACEMKLEKYGIWEREGVCLQYGVEGIVRKKKEESTKLHRTCTMAGVTLCILCAIPLIISSMVEASDLVLIICLDVLLVIVSIGVCLLTWDAERYEGFQILLQEGDFTPELRMKRRKLKHIQKIYWCLLTAVYVGISLYTFRWRETWVIWPCAAILYKAVSEIAWLCMRHRPERYSR